MWLYRLIFHFKSALKPFGLYLNDAAVDVRILCSASLSHSHFVRLSFVAIGECSRERKRVNAGWIYIIEQCRLTRSASSFQCCVRKLVWVRSRTCQLDLEMWGFYFHSPFPCYALCLLFSLSSLLCILLSSSLSFVFILLSARKRSTICSDIS